jgi:filamentous hemagglutinin
MGSIAEIAKHEAVTRKIDQAKSVGQKKLTPQELGTEASTLDKVPYSSKTMESMLRVNNPGVEIISTTLAKESHPNTSLAGGSIERKVMIRPEAGEFITQRIIFNERGFPIFDKYVKCETRISADLKSMSREAHMRAATRQLRADIEAGIVPKNMFNEGQLSDITKGIEKIRGFTWHHHEDVGRMQLVPEDIHEFVKHVGGFEMWGGEK